MPSQPIQRSFLLKLRLVQCVERSVIILTIAKSYRMLNFFESSTKASRTADKNVLLHLVETVSDDDDDNASDQEEDQDLWSGEDK